MLSTISQALVDVLRQRVGAHQDVVIFTCHVGNPAFNNALEVVADQRAGNRGHRDREDGDAQNDHGQGEHARIGGVRHDVAKAHGRHHHNGEIERGRQIAHLGCKLVAHVERAEHAVDDQ